MKFSFKKIIIPGIVLVISIAVSVVTYGVLDRQNATQLSDQFMEQTAQMTSVLDRQINLYTYSLYSSQGLFAASESVRKDEWHSYINTLNLSVNYPGISGMNYIVKLAKADVAKQPYVISPVADKDTYYPVIYLEPFTPDRAKLVGFDISSEPKRVAAFQVARDTDQPTASGIVAPVPPSTDPAFSIYLPIYKNGLPHDTVEERQTALQGFVSESYRVGGLFANLTNDPIFDKSISMTVYDTADKNNTDQNLLVFSTGTGDTTNLTRVTTVTIGGRTWSLHFAALPDYALHSLAAKAPLSALLFGIVFSLLIFFVIFGSVNARERAEIMAQRITKDLEEISSTQEAILNGTEYSIISIDATGKIVTFNSAAERMLGYTKEEMIGQTPAIFHDKQEMEQRARELSEEFHREIKPGMEVLTLKPLMEGKEEREWISIRKDGTQFPSSTAVTVIRNKKGEVMGYVGISQDITERKAAQTALMQKTADLERSNKLMVGRELKMVELKQEIEALKGNKHDAGAVA